MTAAERPTLMRGIVSTSLRFRFLVVAAAVALMVFGTWQLPKMRVDVFPEFAPPLVQIQTICLGLSTSDVESLVTVPLEQALDGVPGLDTMRSKSVPQLSSIMLQFKQGANEMKARQLVQERLAIVGTSLPTWASPPVMLPQVSATARVMQVGMRSNDHSLIAMSTMAYWTIRARLMQVPGVANVAIWGERLQELSVQVDPRRLQAHDIPLDQVMEVVADATDSGLLKFSNGALIGTGGSFDTPNQRISVRHILPVITAADLARVTMTSDGGRVTRVGDVANVVEDHQPLIGDAVVDGGDGLLLVVEKFPWGNTLDVTHGIEAALKTLQPGLPGITFDPKVFQQANFIETAIHNLTQALLLGFLLVVLILMAFLFEWRVALISVLTIPLSLMATLMVLYLRGATINTMTLAGLVIALGAVVDDAIIDVENILRRLREQRALGGTKPTPRVILDASLEVRSPIVYATLIIVAAAVPVFLLQGLTGAFFRPLALSYTLAIVASMVVALTVTPALALIVLRHAPLERHVSPLTLWLQRHYSAALARIVNRPAAAYAVFAVVALAGVALVPTLGQSLFPTFKERDFLIHFITTPGTSVDEQKRLITTFDRQLAAIPGVRSTGAHIGQAFLGEEIAGVNFGENWVSVDPHADLAKTTARIDDLVARYPGVYRDVLTYLNERIEEVLTGSKQPIVVRVQGQSLQQIRQVASVLRERMNRIHGITDLQVDLQADVPQVEVEVNLTKAKAYGLKPGDVRRAASTLVAGEEVGDIFRTGVSYNVNVWSTPATRASVPDISRLLIDTPSGRKIRLGDVARVQVRPNPNVIDREGDSRYIDIDASAQGRDLGAVTRDVQRVVEASSFPRGTHAEVIGEYATRQAAQQRLLALAVVAGVLILLLLQASFTNWRLAFLVFLTMPMALAGGVLAARISGGVISLGSLVGFFTVCGIAARNGILLVNHCQHLESHEGEAFGPALVVRGARERLAPILMTSLATALAVVPLVAFGDRPGHEIEYPLASVILGGLVTSTLLNLFVVPSLYLRFGRRHT
jgi:CzcA family heavy metal efflux pump